MSVEYATSDAVFTIDPPYSKPVISTKEAKKILGKDISNILDDTDLAVIVKSLSYLSKALLDDNLVPQNEEVV